MCESSLIKLSLISGKVLTFDHNDYMRIRKEHHIVGKLIGVPVHQARNISLSGMPAAFNDYEATLMLENRLASVEYKTELTQSPCEGVKRNYAENQQRIVSDLHKPYIESKLVSTRNNMENIIKGKRKKLIKSGVKEDGKMRGSLL